MSTFKRRGEKKNSETGNEKEESEKQQEGHVKEGILTSMKKMVRSIKHNCNYIKNMYIYTY